jgi:hypothetical protein
MREQIAMLEGYVRAVEQSEKQAEKEQQRLSASRAVSYQTFELALLEIKEALPNTSTNTTTLGQNSYLGGFFRQQLARVKNFSA